MTVFRSRASSCRFEEIGLLRFAFDRVSGESHMLTSTAWLVLTELADAEPCDEQDLFQRLAERFDISSGDGPAELRGQLQQLADLGLVEIEMKPA